MKTDIWQTMRSSWQRATTATHFGSSLVLTMGVNGLLAGLALLTGSLAARILGLDSRGSLAAIQTWPTFIAGLAMLGIPDALVYYSAKNPEKGSRLLGTAIVLGLVTTIPFSIAGYYLMPWLLKAQTVEVIQAARVYLWILPLYATVGMLQHPLRGQGALFAWNLVRIWPTLAWLVILIWGWLNSIHEASVFAIAYLIGLAILIIPIGLITKRYVPGSLAPVFSEIAPMLRYGIPSALSSLPSMLNWRLDQMLMATFLPSNLLGLYIVAVAWSSAVAPLAEALSAITLPRVARSKSLSEQAVLLGQTLRLGSLLIVLLVIFVAVTAPIAIPFLFGQEFAEALDVAFILSIAAGFLALKQLLQANILGLGFPRLVLWTESIGLIITGMLLWLLLNPLQLMGAAWASLASYSIVCILLAYQIRAKTDLSFRMMFVPTVQDITLVQNRFMSLRDSLRSQNTIA